MQTEFLLKDILENLRRLSDENREILQKLSDNNISNTKQTAEIERLKERQKEILDLTNKLESRIEKIEIDKIELKGFAKYGKLIWLILVAVIGLLIKIGFKL